MRTAVFVLFFGCVSAWAQDDAASMAMQQAQQANQQAMQAAQQAQDQLMRDSQQAAQQAQQAQQDAASSAQQNNGPLIGVTREPTFSVKAGNVAAGTTVRIKCSTHYATIYYTTDGWTPTKASRRYTGPIAIDATTQLQAIAIAPNMEPSLVARATYTVQGAAAPAQPLSLDADGVLKSGTRLQLVTNSEVNSKTAQVGDALPLLLDQDIKIGDSVVIPKGAPVDAAITQADPAGRAGAPGDLAFTVQSITVGGTRILLHGGETLEGADHYSSRNYMFIPLLGVLPAIATRGDEAEIKPGMTLSASVADDTPLHPQMGDGVAPRK